MDGENTASGEAKTIPIDDGGDARQRSKIAFPYNNLGDAIEVAQAIHSHVGTGECDDTQLAAWLNLSPKSSGYRIQVSAARLFGLVETSSGHKLSALGRMIVDPLREREARAKAFMNVPLYNAVYEKYKGGVLPPAAAFERDIVGIGVSEKQTGRARQIFERSAEQAGFFESGKARLVMPGVASRSVEEERPREEGREEDSGKGKGGYGGSNGSPPDIDPIIQGLLARLPKSGEVWPEVERKLWLQLLEGSFKLIYKDTAA